MKKSTLLIAGLLALGSTSMHADEGMWTLYNLPDAVYEQMVAEGFQLPRNMLYGAPNAISNSVSPPNLPILFGTVNTKRTSWKS